MQVLYSVMVTIDSDPDSAFERLCQLAVDWAWEGGTAPADVFGAAGTQPLGDTRLSWYVRQIPERPHRSWRLERDDPLGSGDTAEFVYVITVSRTGELAGIHVEVGRRSKIPRLAPVPIEFLGRPRLVPRILATLPCRYGTESVCATPTHAKSSDVDHILGVITDPERSLPVVVISSTAVNSVQSRFAMMLADRLAGLAHVAVLDTWLALDSLNARHDARVPLHGARLFWPPSAGTTRHPCWTGVQVREHRQRVASRIFTMLSRLSVVANPRDPLAEAVCEAERAAIRDAAERRVAAAAESGDLHRLADELRRQVDGERGQVLALLEENERLERENRELRTYKENFEAISSWAADDPAAEKESDLDHPPVSPDFDELWPTLEAGSGGALVFTDTAKASWVRSGYPYPERMRLALENLAAAAAAWRAQRGRLGRSMTSWLSEEFGLHYANDDEAMRRRRLGTFEFDGQTYSRLPHVKVDDHVSPDRVGRVYFGIDEVGHRWIVDHVGLKLHGI